MKSTIILKPYAYKLTYLQKVVVKRSVFIFGKRHPTLCNL